MNDKRRRKYNREFKREAVELANNENYTLAEAARSLGITSKILSRWRQEQRDAGQNAFPGTGHESGETEELRRLREENRRLRMEKEILKKAAAFFARESE